MRLVLLVFVFLINITSMQAAQFYHPISNLLMRANTTSVSKIRRSALAKLCFEDEKIFMKSQNAVNKKILDNGMTVLVHQDHTVPKVSTQLWYYTGSKNEKTGEKGIAHLIEHMIFKGTDKLSESDINEITHKLSGYCNAFTSYDYTGYLFDLPEHNWRYALDIMSDCMRNCTFKEEHLNSELKAVIQELKMYKDNHVSDLVEKMIEVLFVGHPYTNPIIGYKHDLWSLDRQALVDFYKQHYVPNNATLVVVGDVNPAEVFALAEQKFGSIAADQNYTRQEFYLPRDITSKSVNIYRDVKQPVMLLAYMVPGAKAQQDYLIDTVSWVVGCGRGSRLHKRLVDELQIATDVESFSYDLFDGGIFFIEVLPTNMKHVEEIKKVIAQELAELAQNGPTASELQRAARKINVDYLTLLESNHKQAYALGKSYLATGDENYLFNYIKAGEQLDLNTGVKNFVAKYMRPSVTNFGWVLPTTKADNQDWLELQKISDIEDQRILSGRERCGGVEPAVCANAINPEISPKFNFPKYQTFKLTNGLEVLFFNRPNLPKINLILELKANHQFDPWDKQGMANFVSKMMLEGTKKHTAQELASEIEQYGMDIEISPGTLIMELLSADLKHGLGLVHDILTESVFDKDCVEKVRTQLLNEIEHYWDDPAQFLGQLIRSQMYPNHPYSKNALGSQTSINSITQADLKDFYANFISPQGARLAVVGDLENCDLQKQLEDILGKWQGNLVSDIEYPELPAVASTQVNYQINRDQVTWGIAGRSVDRNHPDYDKLLLFDQVFTGGALRSMSSRLFELREATGLFYTIGGSLLSNAGKQPGMVLVRTIISQDRLNEAEERIKHAIDNGLEGLNKSEINSAVNAIASTMIDSFDSNQKIAQTFLFLRKYDLPLDYFDTRAEHLAKISVPEIVAAVKKYLNSEHMVTVRVGRV